NRADGHELLDPGLAAALNELGAHDEIFVEEGAGVEAVGADAPHHGRQGNYHLRFFPGQEPADVALLGEVELSAARHKYFLAAHLSQPGYQMLSQEPGSSRHDDLPRSQIHRLVLVGILPLPAQFPSPDRAQAYPQAFSVSGNPVKNNAVNGLRWADPN